MNTKWFLEIIFNPYICKMKISIDIEQREINKKSVDCYIPKINGIPVMGSGYIIKESINSEGKKTDNLDLAKSILNRKINELNNFINENGRFFEVGMEKNNMKILFKNYDALLELNNKWWDDSMKNWAHWTWRPNN